MHVIFREATGLDAADTPQDLAQDPADLVVLSFSDSDLGAFAAGWKSGRDGLPSLRLANLNQLRHPLSVDTYVEQTLAGAKGILVRLLGGASYWDYGLQQLQVLARENGIALAVIPGDGRADAQLDAVSNLPVSTLRRLQHLCDQGGAGAARAALQQLSIAAGLYASPVPKPAPIPQVGAYLPDAGVVCPASLPLSESPRVALVFYRSFLTASDLGSVDALSAEITRRGFTPLPIFVPSLKNAEAARWLENWLQHWRPDLILNATAFSGIGADGANPFDVVDAPVMQVILSGSDRTSWAEAERGLAPPDLAMHVVLPEVDGRLLAGVASFKENATRDADLQFARRGHTPDAGRITAIGAKIARRIALRHQAQKRIALVLSTYPGRADQIAHAVGLDALASARTIAADLGVDLPEKLAEAVLAATLEIPLKSYTAMLHTLPNGLAAQITQSWGAPQDDPAYRDNALHLNALQIGDLTVALQPERGNAAARGDEYHDLARVPRHSYVAFYLWAQRNLDALVHIGAHGTLEWLPGKSVALSGDCWPDALTGDLPVIYPFIVNDPGEAAQAKRRIGALTLGHMTPPLVEGGMSEDLSRLERLLDEYSTADGLDPARRDRLVADIEAEADKTGLIAELGLNGAELEETITRIDSFVCDVKETQFGEGLHVFGRAADDSADAQACAKAERDALHRALTGRHVAPGPSGSPWRGRRDVLPTGRNLFTTDPRAVPSRAAYAQGVKLADALSLTHLQNEGDYLRSAFVDMWGSATMRTAGEEFSMALALIGAKPVWDQGSDRVKGVEITPLAEMDRPRVEVSLRISGLFRDVFGQLITLFDQAVAMLAGRDEAPDFNPYAGAGGAHVFGPAPGEYGAGINDAALDLSEDGRLSSGLGWLSASQWAYGAKGAAPDRQLLEARVAAAQSLVHAQDLPETDVLLALDYASHEAGFAAAKKALGGQAPALYHVDATRPEAVKARTLSEEIARVVRGRAANPRWIKGMMRHGYRGCAEIAATLDHMAAFANLADVVPGHLFEAYFDATLGDDAVYDFLEQENPLALAQMQARFRDVMDARFWETRRNSVAMRIGGEA